MVAQCGAMAKNSIHDITICLDERAASHLVNNLIKLYPASSPFLPPGSAHQTMALKKRAGENRLEA